MFCKIMILLFFLPLGAWADDAELYAPAPPPDSAFVRVAKAIPAPEISAYRVEREGKFQGKFPIAAGKFYTLLGESLIEDAPLNNPAKARVYFYNLSDAKALVTAPSHKNAVIVQEVAAGDADSREMNAVTLTLAVQAAGKTVETFPKVALKRRQGVSVLLSGKAPEYKAILVNNAVAR